MKGHPHQPGLHGLAEGKDPRQAAVELFEQGYNCAEAVVRAMVRDERGASVGRGATGFGAGFARRGATCGAIAGCAIALGLLAGRDKPSDTEGKDGVYRAVRSILVRFERRFGTSQCRDLTGIDFDRPDAQAAFQQVKPRVCVPAVRLATSLALAELAAVATEPGKPPRARGPAGYFLRSASFPEDEPTVRSLLEEYEASLHFDLSFQGFADELRDLPAICSPPQGSMLLAHRADRVAGCVGVRRREADVGELKRLFVRPELRGQGQGRLLTEAAVAQAERLGFRRLRLDTVPGMDRALSLYRALGFVEIPPYRDNPIPGAVFLERKINGRR